MARVARLGHARLGHIRLGHFPPFLWQLSVAGTDRSSALRLEPFSVRNILHEQADIATFRVSGFTPVVGQAVLLGLGSLSNRLFGGRILTVTQSYASIPANVVYDLECVDWTRDLEKRLVLKSYANQPADVVVRDLLTSFASGFTAAHVQSGLGTISIDFTYESLSAALTRIANLVGARWYVDPWQDLHFFTSENLGYQPAEVADGTLKLEKGVAALLTTDASQLRTRVTVEGQRSRTLAATALGQSLPVEDLMGCTSAGYQVRVGATVLTGSADSPVADATVTFCRGFKLLNVFNYDAASSAFVGLDHGSWTPFGAFGDQASREVNDALYLGNNNLTVPTMAGPWRDVVFSVTVAAVWSVTIVWEYWDGGAWSALNPTEEPEFGSLGLQWLRFDPPSDWASTTVNSVPGYWVRGRLSAVASATSVATIGEVPRRAIMPGNDRMNVTWPSAAPAESWFVTEGSQYFFGEPSTGFVSGIPTSGPGAVTAPIPYGTWFKTVNTLVVAPTEALPAGTDVVLSVTRNDATAQTALASAEGGDGIREHYVSDSRLSLAGAEARGDAELTLYKSNLVTFRYRTRDPAVRAGLSVSVTLSSPTSISGTFLIQSVTLDNVPNPTYYPWRTVEASSTRWDLFELLRRLERTPVRV